MSNLPKHYHIFIEGTVNKSDPRWLKLTEHFFKNSDNSAFDPSEASTSIYERYSKSEFPDSNGYVGWSLGGAYIAPDSVQLTLDQFCVLLDGTAAVNHFKYY